MYESNNRMSFRDIGSILKKNEAVIKDDGSENGIVAMDKIGNGSSQSNQKSTQAWR